MGIETLPSSVTVAAGLIIKSADFLTVIAALQSAFVGRNTSGVPSSGQSLGTSLYPWGPIRGDSIIIGGQALDVSGLTAEQNRIISGKVRSTSGQPYFLDPDGAAATVNILATTTNLELDINGTAVSVTADVEITGLTAAPGSNNTCAINDSRFIDQPESKYFGETDSIYPTITIDTVGTEISSLVGQMIALKTGTSEIMFGLLKSTTEFTNVKRGFFFDSSNAAIVRETIADNDTLTLMKTGWIFLENDGTTDDVSYLTPVVSYDSPGSPATSQYWYDITNKKWKRYSGVDFVVSNKTILGLAIIDSSNCIAARSFDFYQDFKDDNTIDLEIFSDEIINSKLVESWINVYGSEIRYNSKLNFNNISDLETGSVAASTRYYLYLSTNGQEKISLERPYDRTGDLRGKYHPYNNWRYTGRAETDSTSDWVSVISDHYDLKAKTEPQFSSKNLILTIASVTTVTVTADEIQLVNEDGKTLTIYDVNETFDITTDIHSGTEKASHDYQLNISANNENDTLVMKMSPILTGTTDSTSSSKLVDSTADFVTDIVDVTERYRPTARNRTDITETKVDAINDLNTLSVKDDIFVTGEDYEITILNPINTAEFKANIGKVYNDSSSNLTKVVKYGDDRITLSRWHTVNGFGSTNTYIRKYSTEAVASDDIVVTVSNSATLGFSVTANMNCEIWISYTATSSILNDVGISINSTQLTTVISAINAADRLIMGRVPTNNSQQAVSWGGVLQEGDILRPHHGGNTDGSNPGRGTITVFAKEIS